MKYQEANFDGLVGNTHNYAGLSFGNIASESNQGAVSNPKMAALQGLEKMKTLHDLGFLQGIIPPQERPNISLLRSLGFTGSNQKIIEKVYKENSVLLNIASSASCMWTANAATVTPSCDSRDKKVHFTPANLISNIHRAQEADSTARVLKKIFKGDSFVHHDPLVGGDGFSDEGAANHTRLCGSNSKEGIEIFVYGRSHLVKSLVKPQSYPARQTLESVQAIARRHQVKKPYYVQQTPHVIDMGVFHNDVISVGNENFFFFHEEAFVESEKLLEFCNANVENFKMVKVLSKEVSVKEAVHSYLFNTQILSKSKNEMFLIAPSECAENKNVSAYLTKLVSDSSNPISKVIFFDLKQSMRNGGGPACLRLRVLLSEKEQKAVNSNSWFTNKLHSKLISWIDKHYRQEIKASDLRDPNLMKENQRSLDELTQIMKLGNIYDFQRL